MSARPCAAAKLEAALATSIAELDIQLADLAVREANAIDPAVLEAATAATAVGTRTYCPATSPSSILRLNPRFWSNMISYYVASKILPATPSTRLEHSVLELIANL